MVASFGIGVPQDWRFLGIRVPQDWLPSELGVPGGWGLTFRKEEDGKVPKVVETLAPGCC